MSVLDGSWIVSTSSFFFRRYVMMELLLCRFWVFHVHSLRLTASGGRDVAGVGDGRGLLLV